MVGQSHRHVRYWVSLHRNLFDNLVLQLPHYPGQIVGHIRSANSNLSSQKTIGLCFEKSCDWTHAPFLIQLDTFESTVKLFQLVHKQCPVPLINQLTPFQQLDIERYSSGFGAPARSARSKLIRIKRLLFTQALIKGTDHRHWSQALITGTNHRHRSQTLITGTYHRHQSCIWSKTVWLQIDWGFDKDGFVS